MRRRAVAVAVIVAFAAAACGTTVPSSRTTGTTAGGDGGLSAPTATTAGSTTSIATGSTVVGNSGSLLSPTSPGTTAASTSSTPGLVPSTTTGPESPITTPSVASGAPLHIGVLYTAGLQQLANAFGAGANSPNPQVYIEDLVSYINKHGGVDGRPLAPVYASINTESSTDLETQYQAACSTFTQDNHVSIVASPSSIDDDFAACITQHDIPIVSAWGIAVDSNASSGQQPLVVEPNAPTFTTAAGTLVRALSAQHWASTRWPSGGACATTKTPEVGVLINDTPEDRTVYNAVIAPEFAAAGTPVKDVIWISLGGDVASAISQAATDAQSAILRFETECVDHLLILTPNPVVPELFMVAASTQHYTPRYGWDSDQAPIDAQEIISSLSSQLRGSLGVGWQPYNDVPLTQFDATAKAPEAHCLAIFGQAGLPATGRADGYSDLQICDSLLFLQSALAGAPQALTAQVFEQQVAGLAGRYAPSLSFRSFFSSSQHDGAAAYRDVAFEPACTCFQYTSGLLPF